MKVLAFFGAFNPPTKAHLSLAELALEKTGRKKVIFVPSKSRYIEQDQGKDFAFSEEERLLMLKTAATGRPWMEVTDWELNQESQPRTYTTLCHLRDEGYEASLLFGSDKLLELENGWLHIPEIAREFGMVVLKRGHDPVEQWMVEVPFLSSLASYIQIVETPEDFRFISSSSVRKMLLHDPLNSKEDLAKALPEEILPLVTGKELTNET